MVIWVSHDRVTVLVEQPCGWTASTTNMFPAEAHGKLVAVTSSDSIPMLPMSKPRTRGGRVGVRSPNFGGSFRDQAMWRAKLMHVCENRMAELWHSGTALRAD